MHNNKPFLKLNKNLAPNVYRKKNSSYLIYLDLKTKHNTFHKTNYNTLITNKLVLSQVTFSEQFNTVKNSFDKIVKGVP